MVLIYILLYFVFIVLTYVFVVKRLKLLSDRHAENTWIESLARWYRIIRRRMFLILAILFVIGSLVILTYIQNDLLYKTWLYDDKKTLDNNAF